MVLSCRLSLCSTPPLFALQPLVQSVSVMLKPRFLVGPSLKLVLLVLVFLPNLSASFYMVVAILVYERLLSWWLVGWQICGRSVLYWLRLLKTQP